MRIGSLFSGYGGLDMAVQSYFGGELAWYSEIDKAAYKVLANLHPDVPNLGDIKKIDWSQVEPVDILTGGYPCQPFSHAGLRKGTEDERHLWPYVKEAISALRPRITVLENVRGHITLGFSDVLTEIAEMGFSARWGLVRASDTGAPHRRERLFIIAYPDSKGLQGHTGSGGETQAAGHGHFEQGTSPLANADSASSEAPNNGRQGRRDERRLQPMERGGSVITDPNSDGHGQQLHAPGMGGVESEAEGQPQQRQRSWSESDPRGVGDAAHTQHDGRNGATVGRSTSASQDQGRVQQPQGCDSATEWGKYKPAIKRWEGVLQRPAPAPTVMHKDRQRLNPVFVEWMMGLPEGHVTGHGLSAAQELKMLGNGVVPQQAALALQLLAVNA